MHKTDRFLLGFVLGALLLVVMVLVLAVRRPPPEYQPEDKPENIALNYLLALQRADYPRAYAALSPALRHYPSSAAEFAHLITINRWMLPGGAGGSSMLRVTDTRRVDASAFVTVRETLLVYWGLWLYRVRLRPLAGMAQRLQLALVVLLVLQTVLVWQVPLLESGTSFARGCTDLAGDSCARH